MFCTLCLLIMNCNLLFLLAFNGLFPFFISYYFAYCFGQKSSFSRHVCQPNISSPLILFFFFLIFTLRELILFFIRALSRLLRYPLISLSSTLLFSMCSLSQLTIGLSTLAIIKLSATFCLTVAFRFCVSTS